MPRKTNNKTMEKPLEKKYLTLVVLSVFALMLLIFSVDRISTTGLFFAEKSGVSYDAELCIRKGFESYSGASIDANGSIGCPLEADKADFNIFIQPNSGIVLRGDTKTFSGNLTHISGAGFVDLSAVLPLPSGVTVTYLNVDNPLLGSRCLLGYLPNPDCYFTGQITTTATTPLATHTIATQGISGPFLDRITKTADYALTVVFPADCNNNGVCEDFSLGSGFVETQTSCPADCSTTATIPSPVVPLQNVLVTVDFRDGRYLADGPTRINLTLSTPNFGRVPWNSTNGCSFSEQVLGPVSGKMGKLDVLTWPGGTVSEKVAPDKSGHFKITALCKLPAQAEPGNNRLIAIPEIF